jgi:EAL domain-containing protein (putative c-di-GMP-specific phosphodiesterase class I)/GGDEF domain-containing protein
MAIGFGAPPSWRGWDDIDSSAVGSPTNAQALGPGNGSGGWFPNARSWMALGAPIELLSPLAVLRVLFGAGVVGFALIGRVGANGGDRAVFAAGIGFTTFVIWVVLLCSRTINPNPCRLLSVYWTAAVATLIVVDGSGKSSVILGFLLLPSTVFVSLFFRLRVVLCQLAVAFVALWVAFAMGTGVAAGLVMATLAVTAMATAPFTFLLGARASRHSGLVDPETGLRNALGLAEQLGLTIDAGAWVAVVALGGVGECREALGYKAGAELLRRAVEDLGRALPAGAQMGRVEGDELVVVAGSSTAVATRGDPGAGEELAGRLGAALERGNYLVGGIEMSLRAHVGMAMAPDGGGSLPNLLRRASHAARRATTSGVPCSTWSGDRDAMTADDLALLADLRRAVRDGDLRLAYQPQFATGISVATSVEALLRWDRTGHGPVPPDRFIVLAERTGLVSEITNWVLGEALDAQVRWRTGGVDLPVSINVSAKDLADPRLCDRVIDELASRRLSASCLTVEITESAVTDADQAVAVLGPLRTHGVEVSIDDFGTGFTSLSALPGLPLDELKIDQGFVRRCIESPADDAIVATTCDLAHRLGLRVVAEGVEDEAIAGRMAELGVDILQGFHLARPLDEAGILEMMSALPPVGHRG